jgi:PAS domain S-box-containing protein
MHGSGTIDVLVVDDSGFFRDFTADALAGNHGIDTRTAEDGAAALSALAERPADCVVSDYEMPGMSGLELYQRVDATHDASFILVTGEGDEQVASNAISAGVDDYLRKDAVAAQDQLDLLANRIRNVVDRRRSRRRYERLVDNSPEEIAHVTADGEIVAANEAMAISFGVDREELPGRQLSEVLPEAVAEERIEHGRRAVTAGSAVTFQDRIGMRRFHNIAVPAGDRLDRGFQLVTRDITEQKERERRLEEQTEELALINRLIRHDINNDVQLLVTWAETAAGSDDPTAYLDRIREVCGHIDELTSTAQDLVDTVVRGDRLDPEPTALDRLLATEIEKKRDAFPAATIEAPATLPAVTVRGTELLSSAFENLLNNAVRHNDTDHPEVTVGVEPGEDTVAVRVADDGPGVPDDRKEEIFGRGEMGPESPGTGIGLYLVRRLVEACEGSVRVEDNDPRGAVFVVEIPRHRPAA